MKTARGTIAALGMTLLLVSGCDSRGDEPASVSGDGGTAADQIVQLASHAPRLGPDALWTITPVEVEAAGQVNPAVVYADLPAVKAIVAGSVVDYRSGPEFPASLQERSGVPSLVMEVKAEVVIKGTVTDGRVYVQLLGARSVDDARKAVPPGSVVALYLERAAQDKDPETLVIDRDAGRPAGAAVWEVGASGMVLADGPDGGVIFPVIHKHVDASFVDQLPATVVQRD